MKPYKLIPIQDCGEPLVPIPLEVFAVVQPHPYEKVGAPYGDKSPFYVRQGVLERLLNAQTHLQTSHPGWKIQLFDAYRPLSVQHYMVDYTFMEVVQQRGLVVENLTEAQRQEILQLVYEFWAIPDHDPTKPPPHSTGGAVDVTLVNAAGQDVDMGSPIDELSPRSYPNHYANTHESHQQEFHTYRQLLNQVMTQAGFRRHLNEWWHFCYGDQMWAWLMHQERSEFPAIAHFGRVA
ncbi:MAG: D-alanyl-D-alanine dipeptidase [Leptolyngbyaceae cyanobacterium RU_5_1]|nr:D-alanyl-D-alanine dipeptidase [Leptolyngbyaceae cyanobacterium RU_5_1]